MKVLIVFMFLFISNSLFAFESGLSFFGAYDLTNKATVSVSGINVNCNISQGPGVGAALSSLTDTLGFSIESAYYFDRNIDTGTAFGVTPLSTSFTQIVTQVNALLRFGYGIVLFGGLNYPYTVFANTAAKMDGDLGYQAGVLLGSGNLSFKVAYQFIKSIPKSSINISSDRYSSEGLVGSVILSL